MGGGAGKLVAMLRIVVRTQVVGLMHVGRWCCSLLLHALSVMARSLLAATPCPCWCTRSRHQSTSLN